MIKTPSYYCASTVYHEARGEEVRGQGAVAHVIYNRALIRDLSIWQVVYQPMQFSCYNKNKNPPMPNERAFAVAEKIVKKVVKDRLHNFNFYGADHYHATYMDPYPKWAKGMVVVAIIGKHIFYRSY